ncbi:MAG TPA: cytochrome-c peroxidase, partial [Bryobacteraceae bacterium]|nr:cytochrome-c peroxidase [Bryobacteraceae bacterium]
MNAMVPVLLMAAATTLTVPLGLDALVPSPDDNPLTREKAALGRKLFFDKRLSLDRSISCATCHDPARAFTDAQPLAVGVRGQHGSRRTPAIFNRAWGKSFFWDGRAASLEDQVVQPILNKLEMDLSMVEAVRRLGEAPSYEAEFQAVFGRALNDVDLRRALASYVRTIVAGDSAY